MTTMKTTLLTAALLLLLRSGAAFSFAPRSLLRPTRHVETRKQTAFNPVVASKGGGSSAVPMVALMSTAMDPDDAADEEAVFFMMRILAVDTADLAENWRWIMAFGIVNVLGGIAALIFPTLEGLMVSGLTTFYTAITLFIVGCTNIFGLFVAEKGYKIPSFLLGAAQVGLAVVMNFYPFETVELLAQSFVALIGLDGILRISVALANRGLQGWGLTLTSGIASVVASVFGLTSPVASYYMIGVMLGINLLTAGKARIALALDGRAIKKAALDDD